MGHKTLPIVESHKISSGLQHAYTLSIVLANPQIMEWYNESYILPIMYEFGSDTEASIGEYLDGYAYSNISAYKDIFLQHGYSNEFIYPSNLLRYIKKFIDSNKYIVIFVDEYFLPLCMMGGKSHFLHEELIYGYDDNLRTIYALGMKSDGHYGAVEHKYLDFLNAYQKGLTCVEHADIAWANENRIITLEIPKQEFDFKYDKNSILYSIKRYLNPVLTNKERYKLYTPLVSKMYIGIDCYSFIKKCISYSSDTFPLLHLVSEHKKILLDHLLLLNISDEKLCNYKVLILLPSNKLRMLALKRRYICSDNHVDKIDKRMIALLELLEVNERIFLNDIIDNCY